MKERMEQNFMVKVTLMEAIRNNRNGRGKSCAGEKKFKMVKKKVVL